VCKSSHASSTVVGRIQRTERERVAASIYAKEWPADGDRSSRTPAAKDRVAMVRRTVTKLGVLINGTKTRLWTGPLGRGEMPDADGMRSFPLLGLDECPHL
jgi:hypothetical protein